MLDFLKPKRWRAVAEVTNAQMTSPRMRRITLGGAEVAAFLQADGVNMPGAWVKVLLPSGQGRAYTIRNIDRKAGTLDLEFVLHERNGICGPACLWASQAQVGDKISIAGPRDGGFRLPAGASRIILAGDATALPALQAIAKSLPANISVEMYAEVGSAEDRQVVQSAATLHIRWLEEHGTPGKALRDTVMGERDPVVADYVWIAGESGAVRALRAHYQLAKLDPAKISAKGYWKVGEAAHRES